MLFDRSADHKKFNVLYLVNFKPQTGQSGGAQDSTSTATGSLYYHSITIIFWELVNQEALIQIILYWRLLQSNAICSEKDGSKMGKVSRYELIE